MESNGAIALGVMYMALPYKYSDSEKDDGYKYYGFLRNLESGIEALDTEYLSGNTFLPIKINKAKKDIQPSLKEESVYSNSDFNLLMNYAKAVVARAVVDIESGYIAPRPISCEYCTYGNICKQFETVKNKRQMPKVVLNSEE